MTIALARFDAHAHERKVAREVLGRNPAQTLEEYEQTNDRSFAGYQGHLGGLFVARFPVETWLDCGAGFALATLTALFDARVRRVVVINAQDCLQPLREKNYHWFRTYAGDHKTARIAIFAGYEGYDAALSDCERGLFRPGVTEILIDFAAGKLSEVERAGQFRYLTGLARDVLPDLHERFSLITDLFGAYFYSAERPALLAQYYQKLTADGAALIVLFARDIRYKKCDECWSEYGPRDQILTADGRRLTFAAFLVEAYPNVFSIHRVNDGLARVNNLHRLLVMRRDPSLAALTKLTGVRIERVSYGREGIDFQIPSVVFVESDSP